MAESIDPEGLRQVLAAQKENIDTWARGMLHSAKGAKDQHIESRNQHKGTHPAG
jgi:hypothetical protein